MMNEQYRNEKEEYARDDAWEATMEEARLDCRHEFYSITDEGLTNVDWPVPWGDPNKQDLEHATAWIEVECDDCARTNYMSVPYKRVLELLRTVEWEDENPLIDPERWEE